MMKKLTYITSFLLTLVLLAVSLPTAAAANFDPGFETKSDSIYLVNLDTDTPVYQKNEREKRYQNHDLYCRSGTGERPGKYES